LERSGYNDPLSGTLGTPVAWYQIPLVTSELKGRSSVELVNDDDKVTPHTLLGKRLRRERQDAGLSLRALAEQLGYPHSYLSLIETGKRLPSEDVARALDTFFETRGLFVDLLEMAHDSLIPDYSRRIVNKEPEAERIQVFTSSLIPGLLQTEEYARELFRRSLPGEPEDQVHERVAVRMRRKGIFEREEPPYFWALMDEAALKRPIGSSKCMTEQLHHLLQVADKPRISIHIVPFAEGAHPLLGGCLTLLTLRNGGTMAFVESFASGDQVESPRRVLELTERLDVARSMALSDVKSLELIQNYLREYEGDHDS
jgi:transcriptional regulator with XRE-family HTH domain